MEAIIYTSNAGTTEKYARLLGRETGLPVYEMSKAQDVKAGAKVIYLGWLMASQVKGYKKAAKKWKVCAVCGVCMAETGSQLKEVRERNKIATQIPVFTLQGGFDITKLHGIYKMMMKVMIKTAGKGLANKVDKTPEEERMYDMMMHGGNYVSLEHLKEVLKWYSQEGSIK